MKNLSRKEALEILNGMKVEIKIPKAAVMQNKRNAALDMAIEALRYSEIPNSSTDCISRQAAIDAMKDALDPHIVQFVKSKMAIEALPSAQPEPSEITDERAILHLQSTGWMQNHDREIYESGLKERLADDSESYDSLIPYEDDGDTISRQAAVDVVDFECGEWRGLAKTIINKLEALPAVQPERVCVATVTLTDEQVKEAVEKAKNAVISVIEPEPHWIPCSERLPEEGQKCLVYDKAIGFRVDTYIGHGNPYNWELFVRDYETWMPLPEPYKGGDAE